MSDSSRTALAQLLQNNASLQSFSLNCVRTTMSDSSKTTLAQLLQNNASLQSFTREACSTKVSKHFLKAPQLARCQQCVAKAGCELQPNWAGGTWLLTSLSKHQVFSLLEECPGIKFQTHHFLVRSQDIDHVKSTRDELLKRFRPNVKVEYGHVGMWLRDYVSHHSLHCCVAKAGLLWSGVDRKRAATNVVPLHNASTLHICIGE